MSNSIDNQMQEAHAMLESNLRLAYANTETFISNCVEKATQQHHNTNNDMSYINFRSNVRCGFYRYFEGYDDAIELLTSDEEKKALELVIEMYKTLTI